MDHYLDHDQYLNRDADWERDEVGDDHPGARRGMGRGVYRETNPPAQSQPEQTLAPESNDLTLGMTALLGIFLAAVLVCAVFFGFGYSTGRTLHGTKIAPAASPAASSAAAPRGSASAAEDSENTPESDTHSSAAPPLTAAPAPAKPSAGAPMADPSEYAAGRDSQAAAREAQLSASGNAALTTQRRADVPATRAPSTGAPAGSDAEAGGVMVQIAAVMHQGDADMLAKALRGNGYAAIVRTEPHDKFLHVQVGPFATRDQAKAMRARLQGDGYNAFLKP